MLRLWHSGINLWLVLELNSKSLLHSISSVLCFVLLFFSLVCYSLFVLWVFSPPDCLCRFLSTENISCGHVQHYFRSSEVRSKNRSITEMKVFLRDSHSALSYFNPSSFPLLYSKQLYRPAYLHLYMH